MRVYTCNVWDSFPLILRNVWVSLWVYIHILMSLLDWKGKTTVNMRKDGIDVFNMKSFTWSRQKRRRMVLAQPLPLQMLLTHPHTVLLPFFHLLFHMYVVVRQSKRSFSSGSTQQVVWIVPDRVWSQSPLAAIYQHIKLKWWSWGRMDETEPAPLSHVYMKKRGREGGRKRLA